MTPVNIKGMYSILIFMDLEKNRFIPIFQSNFITLANSVREFKTTLENINIIDTKLKFLESSRKRQIKLCEKLKETCMQWQDLLLHEDFDDRIERLNFSYSPDK